MLRFITCGSVDDGKSTLIGRLLWESKQLFDDQISTLIHESKKYGTQGSEIDFALLVDGLSAEREQGITIDVAYRFFSTSKQKFIVADTPGHEQYTRNMVTGASTADLAVLVVDARNGMLTQTYRHTIIASLMCIPHVVLAINKMDIMNFDEEIYQKIKTQFEDFASTLKFETISAIPMSALKGDNVFVTSTNMPWYKGISLISHLENISIEKKSNRSFVFPVQWVNRPHANFRGFSGTVAEGCIKVNDEIRVTSSGQCAKVASIVTMDGEFLEASNGTAVTLQFDKEIDASRGDVISLIQSPLEMSDQFKATLIWMHVEAGLIGRTYDLKLATQWTSASITDIKYKLNINTFAHESGSELSLNDVAVCTIALHKPIAFDSFESSKTLGSFILVDRFSHATVAAGLIQHSLRRAQNVHVQNFSITYKEREYLNTHVRKVIWFTGLSGSGKSTIANALEIALFKQGKRTYILDGDNLRQGLNKDLGFTDADRVENIRRMMEVAKLMMDAGLIVMITAISPFKNERDMARELIGSENFIEVYVNTPMHICESRDPKGLYKKARAGLIPNMTGIHSSYEAPDHPEIVLDEKTNTSLEQAVTLILQGLQAHS